MSVRGCVDIQTNAILKQSNQLRLRTVQQHTHLYSSNRIATLDSERAASAAAAREAEGRPKPTRGPTEKHAHILQSVTSSSFYLLYMFLHFVRPRSSVLHTHSLTHSLIEFRQHCYLTRRTHISVRPFVLQTDTLSHLVAILGWEFKNNRSISNDSAIFPQHSFDFDTTKHTNRQPMTHPWIQTDQNSKNSMRNIHGLPTSIDSRQKNQDKYSKRDVKRVGQASQAPSLCHMPSECVFNREDASTSRQMTS